MKAFCIFELVVVLLCGAVALGVAGQSSLLWRTHETHVASSDVHVSLFWMRRVLSQPYRAWFLHDTDAYDVVPVTERLPHAVVEQGQLLFPLHVLYLRLCGQWLQWTQPDVARALLQPPLGDVNISTGLAKETAVLAALRHSVATVAAACVVVVGAPGSWCLVRALTQLLSRAAQERVRVARVLQQPQLNADAEASAHTQGTDNVAVFLGALLIVVVGLLPLVVVEACTLQPWCVVGSLLVWAVYAVLQDELHLHVGEAAATDDAFDLTAPVLEEGPVVFYALKRQPRLAPLVSYTVIATCLSLTMTAGLYFTPVFFIWGLTSCWQHGYKRVLVKVKASDEAPGASDGYLRVGYSCYTDKMYMNACFSKSSLAGVLTVLLLTTPWWWHQQPLLSFMDLFASPPLPDAAAGEVDPLRLRHGRSFTGAGELHPHCLSGPRPFYTCAVPTANGWLLSEWFGLPWTRAAKAVTRIFATQEAYVDDESARWLEFATVVLAVLTNAASVLVLTFYRIRKPPLSFETPVRYAAARAAHRAELQAYWEAKRQSRRGGKSSGSSGRDTQRSAADGSDTRKRTTVVTCLCREEYIVKQVVLLCWMLSVATAVGAVLFARNNPAGGVLSLTCGSLLAAVYAIVGVLRRADPLAFAPLPSAAAEVEEATTTEGDSAKPTAKENANQQQQQQPKPPQQHDPSALTQQDGDDPRPPAASRWCTSAVAPSLAHAADPAWLQMIVLATILSTGAATWAVVPSALRQGGIALAAVCVGVALWRLGRWASVDFTSSMLFLNGGAISIALGLLLLAQLVPQTTTAAASVSAQQHHHHLYYWRTFTDRFGDMHARTEESALRVFVYQCAVAWAVYVTCVAYASLRIGRLALEPEEMSLVPIESELSFFSKPAQTKKQQ